MGPESFPGACQLTVWGGVEDNETPFRAMLREIEEEIGGIFLRDNVPRHEISD